MFIIKIYALQIINGIADWAMFLFKKLDKHIYDKLQQIITMSW